MRIFTITALIVAALCYFGTYRWSELRALSGLEAQGRDALALHDQHLQGWLGRFEALAPIYAGNPSVIDVVGAPTEDLTRETNLRLSEWNRAAGSSDTYVIDKDGTVAAASNWAEDISFLGRNFGFRPYFIQALSEGRGRYFALGTASGQRGFYFAASVGPEQNPAGVAVVKVSVETVERELSSAAYPVFVSDAAGVIIISNKKEWQQKTLAPLAISDLDRIRAEQQFDLAALTPVPFEPLGHGRIQTDHKQYLNLSRSIEGKDWRLHVLLPTGRVLFEARLFAGLVALAVMAALYIIGLLWRRTLERRQEQNALENAVATRTAELRQTQSELVQAGKLALLGQMSTTLSHEFNQPLGAIRSYAENAVAFLDRGKTNEVHDNLDRISGLTQHMAQISKQLTSFARKPGEGLEPVLLLQSLEEVQELLRGRLEKFGVVVDCAVPANLKTMGGATRLQQVFVNLISNAIDATMTATPPTISIEAIQTGEQVVVSVADNGPGFSEDMLDRLFDPFLTTKEHGLGLGLSISYNIIRDFGGTIRAENANGARFVITLRAAEKDSS